MSVRLLAVLWLIPSLAFAQETREEEIAAAQRAKAATLAPYRAHWGEELLLQVRDTLVEQPSGFFPYFDSVYSGGGFTLGAGIRQFTGDRTNVSVAGLYSIEGYKLIQGSVASPGHWSGKLDLHAQAGWRDATQVPYHGLGFDSPADQLGAFRMQQTFAGGDATFRPRRHVLLTAAVVHEDYDMEDPTGDQVSIEGTYDSTVAPGVRGNPTYLHSTIAAGFDWRPAADYARRGGFYQVARHHYLDRDSTYSFDRLDAEIVQHVPILRENWVLSFRGRMQTTLGDDDVVPYFLMPSLGSGSTLRGFSSWRFRDRHAVLFNGEWRWIPSRLALDMALFFDAGMVAPRIEAIAMESLATSYGIGVRFHGPTRTPLRVELARSREGTRIVFAASAAF